MYTIEATARFLRTAAKFFARHEELRGRFTIVVDALRHDPFMPALKLHALKGRLAGLHAVRLTYQYRITLIVAVKGRRVTLIDIGSHDEVY